MVQLVWNAVGDRRYETGVDRGVLFLKGQNGVVWNGLISVSEKPTGGKASSFYADGVKYLNAIGNEDFEGTIEAYTYPDEFMLCDGTASPLPGLGITQQRRKPFDLCYRTIIGNDIEGTGYGYKLHLIYNVMAKPSSTAYSSLSDDPEAISFSWDVTTVPVSIPGLKPSAHITIDSTKVSSGTWAAIENELYGTTFSQPVFPTPERIFAILAGTSTLLAIQFDIVTGLSVLIESGTPDLTGEFYQGLYTATTDSRLVESIEDGLYTLET